MKKIIVLILCLLTITGCAKKEEAPEPIPEDDRLPIVLNAYIVEGEPFEFRFNIEDAIPYELIRDNLVKTEIGMHNWRSYFEDLEVYREHYLYDEKGEKTSTYMKGKYYTVQLLKDYYFADNYSRNGLEFNAFVDGYETRTMVNDGITYDEVRTDYLEERHFSGADPMFILTDFVNSWDETTVETYSGKVNNFELINIGNSNGDISLLKSSVLNFRHFKDNIYYLLAADSKDDYYVFFVEDDDGIIDREDEYLGSAYHVYNGRVDEWHSDLNRLYPWAIVTDLVKAVEDAS